MATGFAKSSPAEENLHAAICLLALITQRPQGVEQFLPHEERRDDQSDTNAPTKSASAKTEPDTAISSVGSGSEDPEQDLAIIEDDEDEDVDVGVNEGVEGPSNLTGLCDKVLDRLAETLARFKSDPKGSRGSPLDPKHVSSTMMIEYCQSKAVKFLCAKNEGLYQRNTTEDTDFLDSWRKCLECISTKRGREAEEAKESLTTLVLEYQRPRIIYFTKKLRDAFTAARVPTPSSGSDHTKLSEENLMKIPSIRSRKWIDDNENEFKIGARGSTGADANSEAAASGDSFTHINADVEVIFDKLVKLCHSDVASSAVSGKFTDSQRSLLKEMMSTTLDGWKSVRHRSAIKTRLCIQFQNVKQGSRWEKVAVTAITFLTRVYLGVSTFIHAAEKIPAFRSIECVSVKVPPPQSRHKPSRESPLQVVKRLGIEVAGAGWANQLQKQTAQDMFSEMRKQKRHIHAELQVLHHYDTFYKLTDESSVVHPYIGCSKRCCFLCYCLVRAHGSFRVRGTHETIMPRWEIPATSPTTASHSEFKSATARLFNIIITVLRNTFQQCYYPAHGELLAQSSAAMSTAHTVLDRESGEMEKSQLNMRQLMMTPMVANDSVLITPLLEKPGFAYVIGGTLGTRGREMLVEKAELFKANDIRSKLGLEKQEDMPPRQELALKRCRLCQRPADSRCSACRMSYCSKVCQRKDWNSHVFICAVKNRPNDFDRLRAFLMQRLRIQQDESARSKFLFDLFSDDHLCRTFGFVNCSDYNDVLCLLYIYSCMAQTFKSDIHQLEIPNLGQIIEDWIRFIQANNRDASLKCDWIPWFLNQRAEGFQIPNWDGQYACHDLSIGETEEAFSFDLLAEDRPPLSSAERAILALYFRLFRPFNNIPDACSSAWIEFGFCFCKNDAQRRSLAKAYLELAKSGASLKEIAQAWDTSSLPQLLKVKGLDLSFLKLNGIRFQRPDVDELGVYRLMAEVNHALSGRFCHCFRFNPAARCHPRYESHLSIESDGDYGFHGTSAYERWQLFNFYGHVFRHPDFDARKMLLARRDSDSEALERYLDSLVPGFRFRIGHMYLKDAMFPKIAGRVRFPNGRPHCYCVAHDVMVSEGVDWGVLWRIRNTLKQETSGSNEEDDMGDSE